MCIKSARASVKERAQLGRLVGSALDRCDAALTGAAWDARPPALVQLLSLVCPVMAPDAVPHELLDGSGLGGVWLTVGYHPSSVPEPGALADTGLGAKDGVALGPVRIE
eukprot:CAMPEP_0202888496 /NCGR_PEP_ID=MMETSP1391-20130828/43216_1 /ASSEMBLY_ACC=CAM_ASM_000867 /TAXON_ID=1034604 /ORGANISM="Chlamydomonas leiostraca, Strain SAG 11-49" /LENGTH=108 /DNA_ID=CAMNT_0049571799 /DNA_START=1806 /DNA_END=2129 /DNA_ORIENTATION=-